MRRVRRVCENPRSKTSASAAASWPAEVVNTARPCTKWIGRLAASPRASMWSSQASGEAAAIAIFWGAAPWVRCWRAHRSASRTSCLGLAQETALMVGVADARSSIRTAVKSSQFGIYLASAIQTTSVARVIAESSGRQTGDISVCPRISIRPKSAREWQTCPNAASTRSRGLSWFAGRCLSSSLSRVAREPRRATAVSLLAAAISSVRSSPAVHAWANVAAAARWKPGSALIASRSPSGSTSAAANARFSASSSIDSRKPPARRAASCSMVQSWRPC